ncbi:ATP-binding protein [Rhodococcus koreensis]|uniref:ATP-binding protein n=1 Tax=Rhodococcus koreensis TaxID=99653 RepID=UPI00366A8A80
MSAAQRKLGNVPCELTSFVGRRREAAETKRLLSVSRLVTLTGIGGVGKTRLALRVADDARRAFANGVWLVGFGELQAPELVEEAVASALGVREQSASGTSSILQRHLHDQQLLLVLDNCEHLVDAVAALAESLLKTCPKLRILATSREPLGIDGEATLRVPPLPFPDSSRPSPPAGLARYDSVALFAERASRALPGFAITDDNGSTIARICERLDGLPLPIELATARLRAMTAQQILDRLTDRYTLLTSSTRGAPSRQQTLRLCVDWSYDLCTPDERALWGRLAVFAGGFELDSAEGICAGDLAPGDVLDVVASLVDKSILIREEAGDVVRFRLLDTLRDYGLERLRESGEYDSVRRKHRDWFERLASDARSGWIGPRQLEWVARLNREQPNLREALEFSVRQPAENESALRIANALYLFWRSFGLLNEGRHWFDRALTPAPTADTAERITALHAAGMLAGAQGDLEVARAFVEEGRVLADRSGDTSMRALVTSAEGFVSLFRGDDLAYALACFESARDVFHTEGDSLQEIWALLGLGLASAHLGDVTRAVDYQRKIQEITEAHGESVYRGWSLWTAALAMWQRGEHERANDFLQDGLRQTRRADDRINSAWCMQILAWIAADDHSPERAATLMGAAEALWQGVGSPAEVFPQLAGHQDERERRTRRDLGGKAFDTAFRHGSSLSFGDAVAFALNERPRPIAQSHNDNPSLSRRERQVAELVAEGLTNKAIATTLVISQRTAQGHVEHILVKLGFSSRAQIAAWVVEQGQSDQI